MVKNFPSLGRHKVAVSILIASLLAMYFLFPAYGQEEWTSPYRLSTGETKIGDPALVTDSDGFIHVFWPEEFPSLDRTLIQYSRFDGETWSPPIDIHISREFSIIGSTAADIDRNGNIHIVWTEGFNGNVLHTMAPAMDALSATKWIDFNIVGVTASEVKVASTPDGRLHVAYAKVLGDEQGLYHTYSDDDGTNWSKPQWLDPDIPPGFVPSSVYLDADDQGGLHIGWSYNNPADATGDWVRYTRSLDNGLIWEQPFTIAKNDEGDDELNGFARPVLVVDGSTVHIVWAGGDLLYRHHRYSEDRGATWSPTARILGNLNGQAGDGMVVDDQGRLHFFGQIRFPQGIWHAIWDGESWAEPELIYIMVMSSSEAPEDNVIQAHRTFPAIRNGNQIVLTFTDPPQNIDRRLFSMIGQLSPEAPIQPSVHKTATPTAEPQPTPTPDSAAENPTLTGKFDEPDSVGAPNPSEFIWFGSIPVLLFIIGAVLYRVISTRPKI